MRWGICVELNTKLIGIFWCPRWDKEDALFYIGKSWEFSFWNLHKTKRFEFYSTRIQIGPIRIQLGYIPEAFDFGPVIREPLE
jgi:hypothetical protein